MRSRVPAPERSCLSSRSTDSASRSHSSKSEQPTGSSTSLPRACRSCGGGQAKQRWRVAGGGRRRQAESWLHSTEQDSTHRTCVASASKRGVSQAARRGLNNRGTHLQQVLEQRPALLRQLGCHRHAEFACGGCLVDKIHSAAGQGVQPRSSTSEPAAASNKYRRQDQTAQGCRERCRRAATGQAPTRWRRQRHTPLLDRGVASCPHSSPAPDCCGEVHGVSPRHRMKEMVCCSGVGLRGVQQRSSADNAPAGRAEVTPPARQQPLLTLLLLLLLVNISSSEQPLQL